MGYRHYLLGVENSRVEKFIAYNEKEFFGHDANLDYAEGRTLYVQLHEFGKLYFGKSAELANWIQDHCAPVFEKQSDYELYYLKKEQLESIIEQYKQIAIESLEDVHKEEPGYTPEMKAKFYIDDIIRDMYGENFVDLTSEYQMTGSWMYIFAIFNLIAIYKNFDWEHATMFVKAW